MYCFFFTFLCITNYFCHNKMFLSFLSFKKYHLLKFFWLEHYTHIKKLFNSDCTGGHHENDDCKTLMLSYKTLKNNREKKNQTGLPNYHLRRAPSQRHHLQFQRRNCRCRRLNQSFPIALRTCCQ